MRGDAHPLFPAEHPYALSLFRHGPFINDMIRKLESSAPWLRLVRLRRKEWVGSGS